MQEVSQRLAIVVLGLPGHAGIRCPIEAVIRPRIHVKLDRHPGAAQSIPKIAYCQAVARFGLRGFRSLVLPKLILGRYPHIPYFVGSDPDAEPPPRLERSILHAISFEEIGIGNMRLILAAVRLFANSGTDRAGPPIYRVIVGAPLRPRARRS